MQVLEIEGLLDQERLLALAEAIDRSDGVEDGRLARPIAQRCERCGRMNPASRPRCLYCGSEQWQAVTQQG